MIEHSKHYAIAIVCGAKRGPKDSDLTFSPASLRDFLAAVTPTAAQRQPLIDRQITRIIDSMPGKFSAFMKDWDLYEFARAIEAAHGIKENT